MQDNKNLDSLQALLKVFDASKIVSQEDIDAVLSGIVQVLSENKTSVESLNASTKAHIESVLEKISQEHEESLNQLKAHTESFSNAVAEDTTNKLADAQRKAEDLLEKIRSLTPQNGKDADENAVVDKVLAKIVLPEYKETVLDDGFEIVAKINDIDDDSDEYKIDVVHIRGLPKHIETQVNKFRPVAASRYLANLADVNVVGVTNGQVLAYNTAQQKWIPQTAGAASAITGLISAGTGISLTGIGTSGSPYVITATAGGGSVTSFAFTNGGGFTGTVTNATTTPTLSLVLQNSSTSQSGQLTSTDWNTFNGKQNAITLTTTGTSGAATFSGGTLNIPQYAGTTYTGTTNRITVTGTVIDISASYVGQSSITTLGTITTGNWTGTTIAIANGGTGQTTAANAINALLPTQTGNSGKFLTTNGTVASWGTPSGGSATPGGSDGFVQFNQSGSFGGNTGLYYDYSSDRLGVQQTTPQALLHIGTAGSSPTAGTIALDDMVASTMFLAAPNTIVTPYTFTLPTGPGTNGYYLKTDGSGGTSWAAVSGSGTVTSVTSANGNATVATTTTTPVITIVSAPKLTTARTIAGVSFDGSANISIASTNLSDTASIALLTSTQTLTNKRITKRVVTEADATSWTPAGDSSDLSYQSNSQTTGTLTMNAPSGTPTNGQSVLLKIKSTNVQTYSWNAIYTFGNGTAPTASSGGGKIDYYPFIYDTVNSKWNCTLNNTGF